MADGGRQAKIAIAGAGGWGQGFTLPHLSTNVLSQITAIIEPCLEPQSTIPVVMRPTEELGKFYGVPIFKTIDEFLESAEGKATDGLIIATNHATHHEVGMKAIKAGLHILMEKPVAIDPQDAKELMEAASKTDKIFMVNNTANFREHAKTAHDLIRAGEIGTVQMVICYMGSPLGWLFEDPRSKGWVVPTGKMLGNGFGWGQISHILAWVYLVTGLEPVSVVCSMGYSDVTGADIYDSAIVTCKNGAMISVQGVGNLPGKSKQIQNRIFGSGGMLLYCGEDLEPESGKLLVRKKDGSEQVFPGFYFEEVKVEGDGPDALKAFINGCLGKPFFNAASAEVGYKAVQTIEAMYRSAKEGQQVAVVS